MSEREDQSRELGAKLAQALRLHAQEIRHEHDADLRFVLLGALDYLNELLEAQDLIDPSDPDVNDGPNGA